MSEPVTLATDHRLGIARVHFNGTSWVNGTSRGLDILLRNDSPYLQFAHRNNESMDNHVTRVFISGLNVKYRAMGRVMD